jgi:hypothetical protein
MIISPSVSAGFVNSYKSFPYLPREIRDNNSIAPYHEFIDLPTEDGIPKWTENSPNGWIQYSSYYNLFLKYYLKGDGGDEEVANGGGRAHSLKAASFGSSLGNPIVTSVTANTLIPLMEYPTYDWSLFNTNRTVSITTQTYVNFGCFYKVLSQDPLRPLNFGGIALFFTKGSRKSYFNYSLVHGERPPNFTPVNVIPGYNNSYQYLNTYNSSKIYEPYKQWIGQPIIKIKSLQRKSQYSIFNQWQFLNYQVQIPTFVSRPDDGVTGKADSCTIMLFFGENNTYLDDGSGLNTGSIQFLYPFLSLH